jgi:hypothetical protein
MKNFSHLLRRGLPVAMVLLSPLAAGAATLTVSWQHPDVGHVAFILERRVGQTGGFAEIARLPGASFQDASVLDGQTYCYRVRALGGGVASGYSNTACGTAAAGTPTAPAAPAVRVTAPEAGAQVSGLVTVKTTLSSGVVLLEMFVDGQLVAMAPPGDPFVWDTTRVVDGAHRLLVRASNSAGTRASHTVDVVVKNATAPPGGGTTVEEPAETIVTAGGIILYSTHDYALYPGTSSDHVVEYTEVPAILAGGSAVIDLTTGALLAPPVQYPTP